MRFKLDENFDIRLAPLVADGGDDVDTIRDEDLSGSNDEIVYRTCLNTQRTLITLDLDFTNPIRFPPGPTEGIIVLRPNRPVLPSIRATLKSVLPELKSRSLRGKLWIAEPGRIRVYDPASNEEESE